MKILIVANRKIEATLDTLFQLVAFLDAQGIAHDEMDVNDLPTAPFVFGPEADDVIARFGGPDIDLIITLGGDGTILHTARLAYLLDAPILGINMGHLGFLANTVDKSVLSLVADALSGEILREARMNLKVTVEYADEGLDEPHPREFFAFNEIAIARGALGHILDFEFSISGDKIATMRGDGLVVATATGSTAYALSAGGPLVGPLHRGMIAVPLAPHTLNSRAIVTEHNDVIEVTFAEDAPSAREVSLFIDGDALTSPAPVRTVRITTGSRPITLLTQRRESFYKQISRTFFD